MKENEINLNEKCVNQQHETLRKRIIHFNKKETLLSAWKMC
jgi:hypothetical protein